MRRTHQPVTVAVTLASLPRPRLSARIPKAQSIWKAGSTCAGRGARCVSTDTSNKLGLGRPTHGIAPGKVAPNEMMATVPGSSTLGVPEATKEKFNKVLGLQPEQHEKELYAIFKADSLSRFYVPAVMMGHDSPPPPSSRMVHILGADEKIKFISHALHGVYDSVQTLDIPKDTRYVNVTGNVSRDSKWKEKAPWSDRNHAFAERSESVEDDGHISNLIVGGRPGQVLEALSKVRHRVDDRTAICYMSDGLGVAEAANNKYFKDEEKRPSIVLGHFSSPVAYNRNSKSVRVMHPDYATSLTGVRPLVEGRDEYLSETAWLRTQSMLQKFATADLLKAQGMQLENWMKVKIPALMFSAVAEPICVLLDRPYKDLTRNRHANLLMDQLLEEIADVVAIMPEVKRSPELQNMLRRGYMKKMIMSQLWGKKDAPSRMALQIRRGALTDIDYLNGFFIQRGEMAGLKLPANKMAVSMVKAKHKTVWRKTQSYVHVEETSRR
ncbi:putative 2-dehydropantoate 2-reductase [Colletotrichum chrysophilum]|uniref:2-dehydropantoate 2-reductase n=1 Tax=Colletotrichum chrysophilum TaxID=1836956 RepID=A0AAD8ZXU0_9PEZI|nr:putative 2-dehydropantoate 2-reductase [Colletotrichum chrysophilum]